MSLKDIGTRIVRAFGWGGEKKGISDSFAGSLYQRLLFNGFDSMNANIAIRYYIQCAPLADAIDTISREIASINPVVFSKSREEFIYDHPILELLQKPNADSEYKEFITSFVNFFNLTGNTYLVGLGSVNRPPLELFVPSPQFVTLASGPDGLTQTMDLTGQYYPRVFNRYEINGRYRFYDNQKLAEIYQVRAFNPYLGQTQNYGLSDICAIYYQIEQYIKASVHNLSMLNKGAKTSGVFTSDYDLSDDQQQRIQEQINAVYAGAGNAGRAMLLSGGDIKFTEMGLTMRDMDFRSLEISCVHTIYNRFKIPLALISPESMKYDNLQQAMFALYQNSIIPKARRIFKEMNNMLMPRFDKTGDLELTFDLDMIPVIQNYRLMQLEKLQKIGCYTINELRAVRGDKPLQGGDIIRAPGSEVVVAKDPNKEVYVDPAEDAPEDREKDNIIDINVKKSKKQIFIDTLSQIKTPIGNCKYSTDEIDNLVKKYGID